MQASCERYFLVCVLFFTNNGLVKIIFLKAIFNYFGLETSNVMLEHSDLSGDWVE